MKIKFNPDDELPLNKTIGIPTTAVVVRLISFENNKYYPRVFLDECLYKLQIIQKCYIIIEFTLLKELMLIKQVYQKGVIFVTTGIFQISVLSFNQMSAIGAMIF